LTLKNEQAGLKQYPNKHKTNGKEIMAICSVGVAICNCKEWRTFLEVTFKIRILLTTYFVIEILFLII